MIKCRVTKANKSHGHASGMFISPEGWRTLAGGNTPGNRPITLHPEGVPESTVGYPTSPISLTPPIPPHPKSTFTNPKSTIDLGYKPLIRVENRLVSYPSPACHKPIIRPENKGIKPKSNRHKPKEYPSRPLIQRENACYKNRRFSGVWRLVIGAFVVSSSILHSLTSFGRLCQPMPSIASLCQPTPPRPFRQVAIRKVVATQWRH